MAVERRRYIERVLAARSSVTTVELARALRVSAETVRRDLIVLEEMGVLRRVYGGAVAPSRKRTGEPPFAQRSGERVEAKARVAAAAAALATAEQTVFVDVGTTCRAVARALGERFRGTVVSHSLLVAGELADAPEVEVLLAPGTLRRGEWSLTGAVTLRFLQGMHFDVALISCGGVDATSGVTDFNLEDTQIKQTVARAAKRAYVVADASKHGVVGRYEVGDWYDLPGLVTDTSPPEGLSQAIRVAGGGVYLPA